MPELSAQAPFVGFAALCLYLPRLSNPELPGNGFHYRLFGAF